MQTGDALPFTTRHASFDGARSKPTQSGYVLPFIDGPTRTLKRLESHLTRLHARSASHPPHRHEDEEIVILRSGRIEVEVEGQVHSLLSGDMLVIASNDLHGIRNASNEVAEYYVVRFEVGQDSA
ncbi:MAG: cupin domain-containing protein [Puniceicoccaceae bacterium]